MTPPLKDSGFRAAILLVALASAGVSAARAQVVITNPDWERKPTGDEFGGVYPPMAADLGIEGRVVVTCRVTAEGVLNTCVIRSEAPQNLGFGAATLELTRYFRVRPKMADGRGVGGGEVRVPVLFAPSTVRPPPDQPGSPISDQALALARELVAVEQPANRFPPVMAPGSPLLARWARPGIDADLLEEGQASLRRAYGEAVGAYNEHTARAYASVLTEDQIRAAIAFAATPAGHAGVRRAPDLEALSRPSAWLAARIGFASARERFCKGRDCQADPDFEAKLPARPPPTVLTPDWLQQPERWQIIGAPPLAIQAMSLRGAARLRCGVSATGALEACAVLGETPRGLGYGAAALGLAGFYRLQPLPPGAGPATVELTIRFPEPPAAPPPFPPQPAWDSDPSEARRALGRRLIEATNTEAAFKVEMTQNLVFLDKQPSAGLAPATRAEARDAIIAGMAESRRVALADAALHYAGLFSEAELQDMIAWRLSPAGQARQAHEPELAELASERNAWFYAEMMRAAGRIFCAAHECEAGPAPTPKPLPKP